MKLPLGYAYAATYAGIRAVEKDDLAVIVSGLPANAAAGTANRTLSNIVETRFIRLWPAVLNTPRAAPGP